MNDRSLISYAFGITWSLFTKNWEIIIGTFFLIMIFPGVLMPLAVISFPFVTIFIGYEATIALLFVLGILFIFFTTWLNLRVYRIYLGIFRNKVINLEPMPNQFKTVFSVILGGLIIGIAPALMFLSYYLSSVSGFLAFIFVSIFFLLMIFISLKLMFFDISVLDRRVGPIEGLKTSWRITKGNWWRIFLLLILLFFIHLAGVLALGVGVLFTVPFSFFALKISTYQFLSQLDSEKGIGDQEISQNLEGSSQEPMREAQPSVL